MPSFRLETNIPNDKIPEDLPSKLVDVLACSLGKPKSYCCASVTGGVKMSWGGSNEPAAQASVMSIGGLGLEENKKHSKALSDCISKAIGIPSNRMYIHFVDIQSKDYGYQGTTFHDILG